MCHCCVIVISVPTTSTFHLWWLGHMMRSSNVPYEIDGFTFLYSAAQSLCSPRMHKRPGTNISASVTSTMAAFPADMSHKLLYNSKIGYSDATFFPGERETILESLDWRRRGFPTNVEDNVDNCKDVKASSLSIHMTSRCSKQYRMGGRWFKFQLIWYQSTGISKI